MPDLGEFEGAWRLVRVIEDARAGQTATFEGRAVFNRSGDGLYYAEHGILRLPGQAPMTAERRYLWRPAGAGIEVCFEDGRFFHAIASGPRAEAHHDCPPDRYAVAYDFGGWPAWSCRWRVIGPRKDYAMASSYARLGACAADGAGVEETSTI
ncbi:DUF6314 family protein [Rhodovulum euryhalinum]|uniref:DUF6314 domain-containing protein n=1 Tax=Rhodovulum euryhalinum TaxID=35805 RepID=A0A4R2KK06_9RHOB|nr:DUF6314 family protein [Rhodovulum euryhalinum]TCO70936.1 hypothetical protein EV655_108178 [Rhodovulum euryhalinum]